MICPKSHSEAVFESDYCLILKSILFISCYSIFLKVLLGKNVSSKPLSKKLNKLYLPGPDLEQNSLKWLPYRALALLRHHTALRPFAHHVGKELAGRWRGLRPGGVPYSSLAQDGAAFCAFVLLMPLGS